MFVSMNFSQEVWHLLSSVELHTISVGPSIKTVLSNLGFACYSKGTKGIIRASQRVWVLCDLKQQRSGFAPAKHYALVCVK